MATQNPIELEGTFPLPEAQLNRFLYRIHLGYPTTEEEMAIMDRFQNNDPLADLNPVAKADAVQLLQQARKDIGLSQPVRKYITDIVYATRNHRALRFGASPRGALGLMCAGQALAALKGRTYVLPDDIKYLAEPVLAHRIILQEEEVLSSTWVYGRLSLGPHLKRTARQRSPNTASTIPPPNSLRLISGYMSIQSIQKLPRGPPRLIQMSAGFKWGGELS